jgi:hypothetical protein
MTAKKRKPRKPEPLTESEERELRDEVELPETQAMYPFVLFSGIFATLDACRVRLADEVWKHAACLSIAEGCPDWHKPTTNDSAAMIAVRKLRARLADAERERDEMDTALANALRRRDELHRITQDAHNSLYGCGGDAADLPNRCLNLKAERDALRAECEAMRPIVEYVSRGRGFVGVEPYPDASARRALGLRAANEGAGR